MKDSLGRAFTRYQRTFLAFTTGQKLIAVLGTGALLLAGFMVFRWASTPSYSPLFSNLASSDASAIIDKLDAAGTPYKITDGGTTITVPKDKVYSSRISLSGQGLPSSSTDTGYGLLDKSSLSTSSAQEQVNFKRAMEGELSKTIEALDGVQTAVVHLALPEKQVFSDNQDPATASVLIQPKAGVTLNSGQVQAITNLVASSIDGLDPAKVTVADSAGQVLSGADGSDGAGGTAAATRNQEVMTYQDQMNQRIQTMLDRVVGPGNSTVAVTANLDFDKSVTETKQYSFDPKNPALSSTKNSELYNGAGAGAGSGINGVVGPDGQMDTSGTGSSANSKYSKSSETVDNPLNTTLERRESAPGSVRNLHVGVVLDAKKARNISASQIQALIASAVGIDAKRGDTVQVDTLPFDRTAETAAKKDLATATQADAGAARMNLYRNAGLIVLVMLIMLLAWLKGRKRAKARAEATTYVVEQLRAEQLERSHTTAPIESSPAMLALAGSERSETEDMMDELAALVERQPEDVAALLRGWLVERP
ncbi:MAG: flagellar basal-body MS-ring/collar protein FliF [Marmoricola sp.]